MSHATCTKGPPRGRFAPSLTSPLPRLLSPPAPATLASALPWTQQACSYLEAFAFAVASAWNLLPGYPRGSLTSLKFLHSLHLHPQPRGPASYLALPPWAGNACWLCALLVPLLTGASPGRPACLVGLGERIYARGQLVFFCKGPERKYFQLHRPHGLCPHSSTLPLGPESACRQY